MSVYYFTEFLKSDNCIELNSQKRFLYDDQLMNVSGKTSYR